MPQLCLDCHKEVAWLTRQRRGLHARTATRTDQSCGSCHPEHAGRDFALIEWPSGAETTFDHQEAGWALEGAHATTDCSSCHRTAFRVGPAAALSPQESSPGWVGLETTCASCHVDDNPHDTALGSACQDCHDVEAWSPAPAFDHADSRYPLTGQHLEVTCVGCHQGEATSQRAIGGGTTALRFEPLTFAECSSCHQDPHRGALSQACSSCHVTRGFEVIDRRSFNHSATRYPLRGRHRSTTCEACHGRSMAHPNPAFSRCDACHVDAHGGELQHPTEAPRDCESCHTLTGFESSTFTVAQHDETPFPLGGAHQTVACADCHTRTTGTAGADEIVHLNLTFDRCSACHTDTHGTQLPDVACTTCHVDTSWGETIYAPDRHADTRLPLEGRHAQVACASCHGPSRNGLPELETSVTTGAAGVIFHLPELECGNCHADPHLGVGSLPDRATSCGDCHTSMSFRPASVDVPAHAGFEFPLEGAHRAVACAACHTGLEAADRPTGEATLIATSRHTDPVDLRAVVGTTCAACHESPHGTQFSSRATGERCEACHGSDSFSDTSPFDHDRDAAFALAGAHVEVPCASCHPTVGTGASAQVTYTPIPHRCEDCHAVARGGTAP